MSPDLRTIDSCGQEKSLSYEGCLLVDCKVTVGYTTSITMFTINWIQGDIRAKRSMWSWKEIFLGEVTTWYRRAMGGFVTSRYIVYAIFK